MFTIHNFFFLKFEQWIEIQINWQNTQTKKKKKTANLKQQIQMYYPFKKNQNDELCNRYFHSIYDISLIDFESNS